MDVVCFSHLRWDFVLQRPQHLLLRAARRHHVYFVEEPEMGADRPRLEVRQCDGLTVVTPLLPDGGHRQTDDALRCTLLSDYLDGLALVDPWLWYYTPMALRWTRPLPAGVVVYDCMDELSAFRGAPPKLRLLEAELLAQADLVFTGGRSLFESKRELHARTHLFPSSVDVAHFGQARQPQTEPADQSAIARPRIGYYGVIDERLDLELLAQVAAARLAWQLVMLGPVAKLEEEDLPRAPNIHWLGRKPYDELPAYLAGWDVATMPFALNEATRYISPTKTPEYLAGGRPVVSTGVPDVVQPYGETGLVGIADGADAFVAAVEAALRCDRAALLRRVDELLAEQSWDRTWQQMEQLILEQHRRRLAGVVPPAPGQLVIPRSLAGGRPRVPADPVGASGGVADLASRANARTSLGGGMTSLPRLPQARRR